MKKYIRPHIEIIPLKTRHSFMEMASFESQESLPIISDEVVTLDDPAFIE